MRFSLFLILLCLYLNQCYGAPPREATSKRPRSLDFTHEEDELICTELSLLPGNYPKEKSVWKSIANKHREKWQQNTPGFPQERSGDQLHVRFKHMVTYNTLKLDNIGSDNWLQKYALDLNKAPRDYRPPYSTEEEKFIIEELSKTSCTQLYASSTWDAIQAKHHEKMLANTPGFRTERKADGLRKKMVQMKQNGKLPADLLRKIRRYEKAPGASSSDPTPSE